ncbi:prolyl-tRNA synthetase associated domain-containing protein [Lactobacillus halodurans]|uniref:Prolyl-tRNA synthetase associated domain-containing protein n=1 Tax=Companilactobacillus halodurans TaxID=2584183 RepID=A0A5P0ZM09_9LACO|nr:prolyl-tRNA synthetase associated domain-containing protein [Companilactobacillus halodurans]MQS75263.1 prolyl-tRNA synthetase associated domain-containing protein [Companilactobacillus halodurans]
MNPAERVQEKLTELKIPFEMIEHPPVYTAKEADLYIDRPCVKTKSLFLTDNKKRDFYLVFMADEKKLDMKNFAQIVNQRHLKFASEDALWEKLKLKPGFVSVFGLLNNQSKDVQVYFEKDIVGNLPLTFHPNDNIKTIFIGCEGLFKFLTSLGFEYQLFQI